MVTNNIIARCDGGGIAFWAAHGCKAINNTLAEVARTDRAGIFIQPEDHYPAGKQTRSCTDVTIQNNIIWAADSSKPLIWILPDGLSDAWPTVRNNWYYREGISSSVKFLDERTYPARQYLTLDDWAKASGENGSGEGNPLLTGTETVTPPTVKTGGYHLTSNSPALIGLRWSSILDDYDGDLRPVDGTWRIGADQ